MTVRNYSSNPLYLWPPSPSRWFCDCTMPKAGAYFPAIQEPQLLDWSSSHPLLSWLCIWLGWYALFAQTICFEISSQVILFPSLNYLFCSLHGFGRNKGTHLGRYLQCSQKPCPDAKTNWLYPLPVLRQMDSKPQFLTRLSIASPNTSFIKIIHVTASAHLPLFLKSCRWVWGSRLTMSKDYGALLSFKPIECCRMFVINILLRQIVFDQDFNTLFTSFKSCCAIRVFVNCRHIAKAVLLIASVQVWWESPFTACITFGFARISARSKQPVSTFSVCETLRLWPNSRAEAWISCAWIWNRYEWSRRSEQLLLTLSRRVWKLSLHCFGLIQLTNGTALAIMSSSDDFRSPCRISAPTDEPFCVCNLCASRLMCPTSSSVLSKETK